MKAPNLETPPPLTKGPPGDEGAPPPVKGPPPSSEGAPLPIPQNTQSTLDKHPPRPLSTHNGPLASTWALFETYWGSIRDLLGLDLRSIWAQFGLFFIDCQSCFYTFVLQVTRSEPLNGASVSNDGALVPEVRCLFCIVCLSRSYTILCYR